MGDLTIVQYIGLAGGPTKEGSVDRVVVYAKDGSARGVSRDDLPNRGDVIVVKRAYSRILADVFRGVLSAGTLIVSILILTTNN
jgi:protein involved in polysaccharide export with SLBB domain